MDIRELVSYLDDYLRISEIKDFPGAMNGLQVECGRDIRHIAVAVDASIETISRAIDAGADLLLVHHGLFWGGPHSITGRQYRRIRPLIASDMGLYSAHLPLDAHPEVGNNAVIARELHLEDVRPFGAYQGTPLGVAGALPQAVSSQEFKGRLRELLGGDVRLIPGGPEMIRTVGVISGGSAGSIGEAAAVGLDAFLTGEGNHHSFFDAMEEGINVFFGGHYATETWGVRALAQHLEGRFGIKHTFIDAPTGL